MVEKTRPATEQYYDYETLTKVFPFKEPTQQAVTDDKTHQYKVSVPFSETADETYYVNEPYQETVTKTFTTQIQQPRRVTKSYVVNLPHTQHIAKSYTVDIPVQIINTAYRIIDQQVPVTKYRCVTRDTGCWKTVAIQNTNALLSNPLGNLTNV